MELAGNPLQNSSLLTGLNSKAQPSWKMLVFGMSLTGKFECEVFPGRRQPKAFPAREEWTQGGA